jgi:hypothetical protein
VVLVALVLPPSFSLVQEVNARSNNADGSSSNVGLLAADASFLSSAPYVAVGVVSVQLKAEYNVHALNLEIFNLVLSVVGAMWVCWGILWMAAPAPAPICSSPILSSSAATCPVVTGSTSKAVA